MDQQQRPLSFDGPPQQQQQQQQPPGSWGGEPGQWPGQFRVVVVLSHGASLTGLISFQVSLPEATWDRCQSR